jgi:hypothetical protein
LRRCLSSAISTVRKHERETIGKKEAFEGGEDAAVLQPDETGLEKRRKSIFGMGGIGNIAEGYTIARSHAEREPFQPQLVGCEHL